MPDNKEKIVCAGCEAVLIPPAGIAHDGENWCADCFGERFFECNDCGELVEVADRNEAAGQDICNSCAENYHSCDRCGDDVHEDHLHWCGEHEYTYCDNCTCRSCDEDEEAQAPERNPRGVLHGVDGALIPSHSLVGIEIECIVKNWETAVENVPSRVGVHLDGSLSNNGLEFITPPASGDELEKLIDQTTAGLRKAGAGVNRSCGLHIHIDGSDMRDPYRLSNLMALYIAFEDVLMSFLPPSRRSNQYAESVRGFAHLQELMEAGGSVEKMEKLWYRTNLQRELTERKSKKYDNSRYRGLNLHSFFAEGHYEVRYHSGTLDPQKIKNWIALHLAMKREAINGVDYSYLKQQLGALSLKKKREELFDLIKLPESVRGFYRERQALFNEDVAGIEERQDAELNERPIIAVVAQ